MSYTPPLSNAVNFDDSSTSYTPPLYNAVFFDDHDFTTIVTSGIASAEAFGVPVVIAWITPTGIVSAEAFGVPTLLALSGVRGALLMHVENGLTQLTTVFW
jgi:hypothetical protein